MTDFAFVIPDPSEFISGGNTYNRQLIDAIRLTGASVLQTSYEQFKIQPIIKSQYIFDSIYFENIQTDQVKIPDNSIGLIHHLASLFPLSSEVFQKIDLPVIQRFAALIVTSQFTKKFLSSNGINIPIVVIEPASTTTSKSTIHRSVKIKAIMVNNVQPRKGLLPFLEAMAAEKIPPHYGVQIIGDLKSDVDYALACMETVRNDSLLRRTIQFKGLQDDLAVKKLYPKSNLFISASYMETFGMSIQEASILGIPLLIMEGGNSSNHVVPGVNGWVETSMTKLVKRFAELVAYPEKFIEIQNNAYNYKHPYVESYQESARLFLKFIKDAQI